MISKTIIRAGVGCRIHFQNVLYKKQTNKKQFVSSRMDFITIRSIYTVIT